MPGLTCELTAVLLADPQFRAAKPGDARQRSAKFAIPAGTYRFVVWDATRGACDHADELSRVQYEGIIGRLGQLAADLLATPEYQQASSPAARKQVADQFLIPHADGSPRRRTSATSCTPGPNGSPRTPTANRPCSERTSD